MQPLDFTREPLAMPPQREPTVAEAIDRVLASNEENKVRLMKMREVMGKLEMLDRPVSEFRRMFNVIL